MPTKSRRRTFNVFDEEFLNEMDRQRRSGHRHGGHRRHLQFGDNMARLHAAALEHDDIDERNRFLQLKHMKMEKGYDGDEEYAAIDKARRKLFTDCGCAAGRGHGEDCVLLPHARAENKRRATLKGGVDHDAPDDKRIDFELDAAAEELVDDVVLHVMKDGNDWWNHAPKVTFVDEECGAQVWHTQDE